MSGLTVHSTQLNSYKSHFCNCTLLTPYVKESLLDCCVMPNDAWLPLGVFGVMLDPHLYPVHMFTSALLT